ncbi:hypothetical protein F4778DRAFT_525701 [Xylariomycetidae sp. FL2044]|nr:hypothetical protein F4778DRAFT_525701 [Xylariomycetidae sp. FL2044]
MGSEMKPTQHQELSTTTEWKKYTKRPRIPTLKTAARLADDRQAAAQLVREREFRHCVSVGEGEEFLKNFLRHHFEEYLDQIRVTCDLTLEEIKMIGNEEDKKSGVGQCRRLFNAPVLSDQVGYLLWCELRQGDALDHSHESSSDDKLNRRREEFLWHRRTFCCIDTWKVPDLPRAAAGQQDGYVGGSTYPTNRSSDAREGSRLDRPSLVSEEGPSSPIFKPISSLSSLLKVPQRDESNYETIRAPVDRKQAYHLRGGFPRRSLNGAEYLAASLASGYCC